MVDGIFIGEPNCCGHHRQEELWSVTCWKALRRLQLLKVPSSLRSIGFAISIFFIIETLGAGTARGSPWLLTTAFGSLPGSLTSGLSLSQRDTPGVSRIPLSEQSLPGITPRSSATTLRCNLCVTALTTVQTARQSGVLFYS